MEITPTLRAVCAGFESGEWRFVALSKYLIRDCLLDFALTFDEKQNLDAETAGRKLAEAAAWLYATPSYQRRGEIGELLLHVVMKQFYNGRPIVAKVYFKDSANDTVKGFDCVHVSGEGEQIELWLGEVKFYSNIGKAIIDVTKELEKHLSFDYLKAQFIAIRRKLNASLDDQALIVALTDKNVSLDKVIKRICVPVLLTYDGEVMGAAHEVSETFLQALEEEVVAIHQAFSNKLPPWSLRIHLCLFPLASKEKLAGKFHEVLTACQTLN